MKNKDKLSSVTVLYLEDDEDVSEEMIGVLENYFKKVYSASDGVKGLELYRDYHPDMIISDIQMPYLNGVNMCKEIKKISPILPCILLTATVENELLQLVEEYPNVKYLTKPVYLRELYSTIEEMIDI